MKIQHNQLNGQVTLEYFVLFAAIAAITIITLTNFDNTIKSSFQGFLNAAAAKISR